MMHGNDWNQNSDDPILEMLEMLLPGITSPSVESLESLMARSTPNSDIYGQLYDTGVLRRIYACRQNRDLALAILQQKKPGDS